MYCVLQIITTNYLFVFPCCGTINRIRLIPMMKINHSMTLNTQSKFLGIF